MRPTGAHEGGDGMYLWVGGGGVTCWGRMRPFVVRWL